MQLNCRSNDLSSMTASVSLYGVEILPRDLLLLIPCPWRGSKPVALTFKQDPVSLPTGLDQSNNNHNKIMWVVSVLPTICTAST